MYAVVNKELVVCMRWITHQSAALALALWSRSEPLTAAAMVAGAVLPDALEHAFALGNRKAFYRMHRRTVHWFGWYVLCVALGAALLHGAMAQVAVGLGFGALSHLFLDALNPTGVPVLPFSYTPRVSVAGIRTGSAAEWVFCAFVVLVAASMMRDGRAERLLFFLPRVL